jgi:hypothetical protein
MIKRRDYIYQFYLKIEDEIIFLENDLILDLNLGKSDLSKTSEDLIAVDFSDKYFFDLVSSYPNESDCYMVAQVFNIDGIFIQQLEINSEKFTIESDRIIFEFDQINLNKAWSSINPKWLSKIEEYKEKRISTLRSTAIETLLS